MSQIRRRFDCTVQEENSKTRLQTKTFSDALTTSCLKSLETESPILLKLCIMHYGVKEN